MDNCKWCDRVKAHLIEHGHTVHEVPVENMIETMSRMGLHTVPQVFQLIGTHDETVKVIAT